MSLLSLILNLMNILLSLSPFILCNLAFLSISILISISQMSLIICDFLMIISKNIFIFHCSEVFKTIVSAFRLETLQFHGTSMFLIFYLSTSCLYLFFFLVPVSFFLLFCPLKILSSPLASVIIFLHIIIIFLSAAAVSV